jgi:hypothetical protein
MPSHDRAKMGDGLAQTSRGFFGHISGRVLLRLAAISDGFESKGNGSMPHSEKRTSQAVTNTLS